MPDARIGPVDEARTPIAKQNVGAMDVGVVDRTDDAPVAQQVAHSSERIDGLGEASELVSLDRQRTGSSPARKQTFEQHRQTLRASIRDTCRRSR